MPDNDEEAGQLAGLANLQPDQVNAIGALLRQLGLEQQRAPQLAHVKNIPCSTYVIGQDFDIWIITFQDNIRACYNLKADDPRLPGLFVQWVSTKLSPGPTRAAFENLPAATKATWALLKPALSEAFTDQKEKIAFLSRLDAHQRQPGQSLRTYKDLLLQKMEKYQSALKNVPEEWRRVGLQRFREGLRNQLLRTHLHLNCPTDSATLDDAFQTATSWENTMIHLSAESRDVGSAGAEGIVSALFGLPTAEATSSAPQAVTPRMAALSNADSEGFDRRLSALETKVRAGELQMAEVKDSVASIKAGMDEMKKEIVQGFGSLRRDLAPQRQYHPQSQQSFQRPQYTPAFQDQRQPARNSFQGQPRMVPGLTQGSQYVNNTLAGARRPAAPYQSQAQSGPRGSYNQTPASAATLGACEETQVNTEEPTPTIYEETAALGNTGHGWTVFPGADHPIGYEPEPLGIHAFSGNGCFQQPAASPQGPPLA